MFEINATYLIFIVSFLLFIMALNQVLLKPVGRVIELRARKIKDDIEQGKSARMQAQEIVNDYHLKLQKTRIEAQAIINEAAEIAHRQKQEKLTYLKEEGRKQLDAAKAEIAKQRSGLIDQLAKQETELIEQIMTKLLGEPTPVNLEPEKIRNVLEKAC